MTKIKTIVIPTREQRLKKRKEADYRRRVIFIAHSQIIFTGVTIILLIVSICATLFFTLVAVHDQDVNLRGNLTRGPEILREGMASPGWFLVAAVLFAIEIGFQFWASIHLLKGTAIRISANRALEFVRFWKNTTIIYTTIDIMSLLVVRSVYRIAYFMAYSLVLFRIYFIYEVYEFINILERKVTDESVWAVIKSNPVPVALAVEVIIPKKKTSNK